jgi:hypothetical protein
LESRISITKQPNKKKRREGREKRMRGERGGKEVRAVIGGGSSCVSLLFPQQNKQREVSG